MIGRRRVVLALLLLAAGAGALALASEGEDHFYEWGYRSEAVTVAGGHVTGVDGAGRPRHLLAVVGDTVHGGYSGPGYSASSNYGIFAGFVPHQGYQHTIELLRRDGPLVQFFAPSFYTNTGQQAPGSRIFGAGGTSDFACWFHGDVDYEVARMAPDGSLLETLEQGSQPSLPAWFPLDAADLAEGENRIVVRATAQDGSRKDGVEFRVWKDTESPVVDWAEHPTTLTLGGELDLRLARPGSVLRGSVDGGAFTEIPYVPGTGGDDWRGRFSLTLPVGFRTLDLTANLRSGRRAWWHGEAGDPVDPPTPSVPPIPDRIVAFGDDFYLHEVGLRFGAVDPKGKFTGSGTLWLDEETRTVVGGEIGLLPADVPNGLPLSMKGKVKFKGTEGKLKVQLWRKEDPKTKVKLSALMDSNGNIRNVVLSVKVGRYPGGRLKPVKGKAWPRLWVGGSVDRDLAAFYAFHVVENPPPSQLLRAVDREGAALIFTTSNSPASGNYKELGGGTSPLDYEFPYEFESETYSTSLFVRDDADPPNFALAHGVWRQIGLTTSFRLPWE